MSAADHLGKYAQGWTTGDIETLVSSLSPEYVLDDPNEGRIPRAELAAYFDELKRTLDRLRGGPPSGNMLELSDVVTHEEGGVLTAWCWWTFPGTPIEGSGLIKVGDEGVRSERLAFYTRLST